MTSLKIFTAKVKTPMSGKNPGKKLHENGNSPTCSYVVHKTLGNEYTKRKVLVFLRTTQEEESIESGIILD